MTLFSDTFEVVNPEVTLVNSASASIWQYDTQRAASGTTSLYFGNIATRTYADGSNQVSGTILTPLVALGNGTTTVAFDLMKLTQESGGFDQVIVNLVDENGTVTELTRFTEINSGASFDRVQLPFQSAAGQQRRVAIVFDSGDGISNDGEGVYIDNLTITQN